VSRWGSRLGYQMSNPVQSIPTVQTPSTAQAQRWRPSPLPDPEIDLAVKTIYDNCYGLEQTSAQLQSSLRGSRMSAGAISVTGSLKGIATGLSTLSNVIVSIDNGSTATNFVVTATPSTTVAGAFDCYVWMPTAAGNTAPIPATSAAVVRWHAWGS
jgi:hypothetical protein